MIEGLDTFDLLDLCEREGITFRKAGHRYVALCPFHADTEPSFFVDADRRRFRCFGCGQHGDAIDFLRLKHGLSVGDALKQLGLRSRGFITPETRRRIAEDKRKRRLVQEFREWEVDASCEAGLMCRACRLVLAAIKTPADLEAYGDRYHDLEVYQHHLDVLTIGTDEQKYKLFEAGTYGYTV